MVPYAKSVPLLALITVLLVSPCQCRLSNQFHLSSAVPPSSIEITAPMNGKNNLKNASHVEIQEGSSVTIECLVTGGKPPAQIKWFRKSVELRPGLSLTCYDLYYF